MPFQDQIDALRHKLLHVPDLARIASLEASRVLDQARLILLEQYAKPNRYAARASTNTPTTCGSGGWTKITLDVISDYNEGSAFRTASSDYLVPADGLYQVAGVIHIDLVATQQAMSAGIGINGSVNIYGNRTTHWPGDVVGRIHTVYDQINLNAGMVVDLRLENIDTGGGATNANVTALPSLSLPCFSIRRLGPKATNP